MNHLFLRTSFLALPCLSLLVSACGGTAKGDGETTQSLSSPLSFPVGVETSCNASLIQLSQGLESSDGLASATSLPTVTLTSSGSVITATVNGSASPLAPVQFTAISGASATVIPGQSLTVPTMSASAPTSPSESAPLPVEGGSITFAGDTFFFSLEMSLPGSGGTVDAMFECDAAGKAPTDCACAAGDVCACRSTSAPPLGVYTQCSTGVDIAASGGVSGGDTTLTLAEQNGALTMTLGGGSNPVAAGTLDLTPTSAASATISGGQSLTGPGVSSDDSCTPGGDLWTLPAWPFSVETGSLTTDGQWITVSLVGTNPCAKEERVAVVCAVRSP